MSPPRRQRSRSQRSRSQGVKTAAIRIHACPQIRVEEKMARSMSPGKPNLSFHPLTPERWDDFEALFGPRGACGGCWCMYWRRSAADYERR